MTVLSFSTDNFRHKQWGVVQLFSCLLKKMKVDLKNKTRIFSVLQLQDEVSPLTVINICTEGGKLVIDGGMEIRTWLVSLRADT